jgi:DNA invertase Pin-like site-specific DNA recombinase
MVAGVLASLAELEFGLGRERRSAAREARRVRGQHIGRPKALDDSTVALARRMQVAGESAHYRGDVRSEQGDRLSRALSGRCMTRTQAEFESNPRLGRGLTVGGRCRPAASMA